MTPEFRDRLIKLLGMLGSEHLGERAAAAAMVAKAMRQENLSWETVIRPAMATKAPGGFEKDVVYEAHYTATNPWWNKVDDVLKNAASFREAVDRFDAMMGAEPFSQYGPGRRGRQPRPK